MHNSTKATIPSPASSKQLELRGSEIRKRRCVRRDGLTSSVVDSARCNVEVQGHGRGWEGWGGVWEGGFKVVGRGWEGAGKGVGRASRGGWVKFLLLWRWGVRLLLLWRWRD